MSEADSYPTAGVCRMAGAHSDGAGGDSFCGEAWPGAARQGLAGRGTARLGWARARQAAGRGVHTRNYFTRRPVDPGPCIPPPWWLATSKSSRTIRGTGDPISIPSAAAVGACAYSDALPPSSPTYSRPRASFVGAHNQRVTTA